MVALLKRLAGVSIVSDVLRSPPSYPDVRNGFERDRARLRGDVRKVVRHINRNVRRYGKEYAD
jgi:hypothetical protein